MEYLFILGRNPKLSIAEIADYFENSNPVIEFSVKKNGMLAEFEKKIPANTINNLGGTIAIGEILASGNIDEIKKHLQKIEIYFGSKNNFNYAVWNFSDEPFYNKILEYLKERFKSEKFKSSKKNLSGRLKLQEGGEISIPNSLTEEEYFVHKKNERIFFGRIIEKANYKEIEERDIKKPVRREELAISPRLAKIMINLSQVNEGQTLVDPFCGIGGILQEALLRKIKVIGIDSDSDAISGAKENLAWANFQKKDFVLINSNSSKLSIINSNVLVSEPDLGETLKYPPAKNKAREIINNYEDLMVKVLKNLENKISGRIVFTAPYIKLITGERSGCNVQKIISQTRLKLHKNFPIAEFREGQVVGRQIFVLEK